MNLLREKTIKTVTRKHIGAIMLMLFLTLIFVSCGAEDMREQELSLQVKIHTVSTEGTGIIIDVKGKEAVVASPYHVIKDYDDAAYIELADKGKVKGAILGFIEDRDIAFLTIDTEDSALIKNVEEKVKDSAANLLNTDEEKSIKAKKVHAYNLYENGQRYDGTIEEDKTYLYDLEQTMMLINICAYEGMSGAGLYDDDANVLGMIIAGNGSQTAAIGMHDVYDYYLRITE
ncbi:MAG: serine protease [Lachnospiraceae bacterium]|nr:serine protease [Lachnospiraceae bacterium]